MTRRIFVLSTSTFFVIACVSTNAALMDPSVRLVRTCPNAVKLFTSPDRVTNAYREIALLNSSASTGLSDEEDMIKSMRKKAADVGANGIILSPISEPNAITKVIGAVVGTGTERKGKSVAIYIPDDSAKVATVCARKK